MLKSSNYNESRVLNTVWKEDGISRSTISDKLGLNKSTVTKITVPLIKEGIILQGDKLASGHQGGRKAEVLYINENFGVIAGIEINTSSIFIVITNLKGNILLTDELKHSKERTSFMESIDLSLDSAIKLCKRRKLNLIGVGLGVSGIINPFEGIIYSSNPLNISTPVKLYEKLEHYPFPIIIENDANCCCSKHLVTGIQNGNRNFLSVLGEFRKPDYISADSNGIAIGLGLVLKGSIFHGDDFSAGEFQSLMKNINNPSQFDLTAEEGELIHTDEEILNRVLRELSRNISLLVNTLNISKVIFEGDIVSKKYLLNPILRDEIQRNWNYDSQANCSIYFPEREFSSVARGAACYFLNKLFSPAEFWEDRKDYHPSGLNLFYQIKEKNNEQAYA